MQAKELAQLRYASDTGVDKFDGAIQRWTVIRQKFADNVHKIARDNVDGLESVARLRQALQRRADDLLAGQLPDEAREKLPQQALDAQLPDDNARARAVSDFSAHGSDEAVRKWGEEASIGANNLLSVEFLERAATAAAAVGCITVAESSHGTGFLVGNRVLVTNHHVIGSAEMADLALVVMNQEENRVGPPKSQEEYEFDPARFFYADERLDVTIVAVKELSTREANKVNIDSFGYLPLIAAGGKILIGWNTNVVQHPTGGNKMVALRDGVLVELTDHGPNEDFCYYTSDTGKGSSGSPVFNDLWQVVALHHHALPKIDVNGNVLDKDGKQVSKQTIEDNPDSIAWEANEGTRISRIVQSLAKAVFPDPAMGQVRDALLDLWKR